MKKIKNVESVVYEILKNIPITRKDDFMLYGYVVKRCGVDIKNLSFANVLAKHNEYDLPSFETVTRCRRHLQELDDGVKDNKTETKRDERQEEFVKYNYSDIN